MDPPQILTRNLQWKHSHGDILTLDSWLLGLSWNGLLFSGSQMQDTREVTHSFLTAEEGIVLSVAPIWPSPDQESIPHCWFLRTSTH